MSPVAQPGRRILVVANRTCPCPTPADEVGPSSERCADRRWVSDVDEALASRGKKCRPPVANELKP
jgi:hypothetical protein